jgi:hypothetical protein
MALHILYLLLDFPVKPIQSAHFNNLWTMVTLLSWLYLWVVVGLLTCLLALTVIRNLPLWVFTMLRKLRYEDPQVSRTFLELTFPAVNTKSAYANEQLHVLLRGLYRYRRFIDRLAGQKTCYSFELVGTNDEGIRYILVVPTEEVNHVQRSLLSFMPGTKIREVSDYMESLEAKRMGVTELKLAAQFAYPLKDHKALEEHDPMAFLTGHMTKLSNNEVMAVQLVVTPVRSFTHFRVMRRVRRIERVIQRGDMVAPELNKQLFGLPRGVWICLLLPIFVTIFVFKVAVVMLVGVFDTHSRDVLFFERTSNKRSAGDLYEQELALGVKAKLDQPLFEVSLRVLVAADSGEVIHSRLDEILSTYQMFDSPNQWFITKNYKPLFRDRQIKRLNERYANRQLTPYYFSYGSIVSSSELSDLYHFPNTNMTKTEGLVKSRSHELAAPLSIRRSDTKLDVTVGVNKHGGDEQPIGMTLEQRQKHTCIIGKTGTGKTTLLKSAIYQDMVNGKGLAVLDPHGDLFRELLTIVPEHRRKDIVVFDPSDRDYPLGLNLLDPGVEFADEDDQREWVTSTVLSIFERLADKKQWGPRMEHILRNTTMTALYVPNASLYTLQRLLTDKGYQRKVAKTLTDPVLKQFWDKEFKLMGSMQMSTATAPLTHRLGHFITTKMSRHILLQEKSTLRIADIMNEGKILLVNLSKGDIGEDQSLFFGTILTSFIWMAAYQRTKIPEKDRRDFFLYVDEFQNFATKQFTDITSEGRKFHISLIASHQNIAQIEDKSILKIVAGNAHAMICLKASPDDEAFILPFMEPGGSQGRYREPGATPLLHEDDS